MMIPKTQMRLLERIAREADQHANDKTYHGRRKDQFWNASLRSLVRRGMLDQTAINRDTYYLLTRLGRDTLREARR